MINHDDIRNVASSCRKAARSAVKNTLYTCIYLVSCCFCCGLFDEWGSGSIGRLQSKHAHRCCCCHRDVFDCHCHRSRDNKKRREPIALPAKRPSRLSAIYSSDIVGQVPASSRAVSQLGWFGRLPYEIRREIFRLVVSEKELHLIQRRPEGIRHLECKQYKSDAACSATGCIMWPWTSECSLDEGSADLLPLLLSCRAMSVEIVSSFLR